MIDFNPARFAQLVVNLLAVGGGFLLGYLLAGGVVWWLGRGKAPDGLKRTARLLGGVAVAVLVFLIVFGHGLGWTLFGGGLAGTDNGSGKGPADRTEPVSTAPDRPPVQPAKPLPPAGERVRVTLLGGPDVKDQRFYLVDDDPAPRTLDEVRTAALRRKEEAGAKGLAVEVRFAATNTLPREHPAVTRLERWAAEAGLTVTFPAEGP